MVDIMHAPQRNVVSVILAAGAGTRMRSPDTHKVCYDLAGKPVIVRTIDTLHRCGIDNHLIVVGRNADQVMRTASELDANILYCFQPQQRGTGNAARIAMRRLVSLGFDGDVLIIAGDKVVDHEALIKLMHAFYREEADFAILVDAINRMAEAGRVIYSETGQPLGIVESFEISRVKCIRELTKMCAERDLAAEETERVAIKYMKKKSKAALALGSVWDDIEKGRMITTDILRRTFSLEDAYIQINDTRVDPDLLYHRVDANLSIYLSKSKSLFHALSMLTSNNAQQEQYLTETVEILSRENARVITVPVDRSEQVMSFNTPEELETIRTYYIEHGERLDG